MFAGSADGTGFAVTQLLRQPWRRRGHVIGHGVVVRQTGISGPLVESVELILGRCELPAAPECLYGIGGGDLRRLPRPARTVQLHQLVAAAHDLGVTGRHGRGRRRQRSLCSCVLVDGRLLRRDGDLPLPPQRHEPLRLQRIGMEPAAQRGNIVERGVDAEYRQRLGHRAIGTGSSSDGGVRRDRGRRERIECSSGGDAATGLRQPGTLGLAPGTLGLQCLGAASTLGPQPPATSDVAGGRRRLGGYRGSPLRVLPVRVHLRRGPLHDGQPLLQPATGGVAVDRLGTRADPRPQ